jgi:DNA-binding protein H-NS
MSTVAQLLAQKAALEAQIEAAQKAHVAEGIAKAKAIIAEFNLTKEDVFGDAKRERKAKSTEIKVAAKYKDPISGKTWSGRGLAPKWLEGKDRSQFAI